MAEAVVFDSDGVLVDSEPLAWQAWRRVLPRYGIEVTDDDVRRLTGRSAQETYTTFAARAALPLLTEITRTVSDVVFDLFERSLRVFPDVPGTLRELRAQGVRLGVGSSSFR